MTSEKPIRIVAMGKYLPEKVDSDEIEKRHGIPSGWSQKYSGVVSRHYVNEESVGFMGARAAEQALKNSNLTLNDIDLIISAGGSHDYIIPNQASIIKNQMEGGNSSDCPAIDIDSTCLSFVTALSIVSKILDGESMKTALIVSSEVASKGLDYSNWETTTLFGDGAGAAVVMYDEESDSCIVKANQKTYSEGAYNAIIEGGGIVNYFNEHPYDPQMHSFKMKGKKMLRMAKKKLPEFIDVFFSDLNCKLTDCTVVIPHQASKMGLHIFKQMYNFKDNQLKESLANYGNCIAASIPMTLADCIERGEIKRGDTCFMVGTSAGFSIG
nr:beta-ketoacyl-ACP synthase III [Candidatus Neomarinimicrobiota bacterium]